MCLVAMMGCAPKYEKPENYPSWSTPEESYATRFHAIKTADVENILKSRSAKYRSLAGKTYEEQLASMSNPMPKPSKAKSSYKVLNVSYPSENSAVVELEINSGLKKLGTYQSKVIMIKENDKWLHDIDDKSFNDLKQAIALNTQK